MGSSWKALMNLLVLVFQVKCHTRLAGRAFLAVCRSRVDAWLQALQEDESQRLAAKHGSTSRAQRSNDSSAAELVAMPPTGQAAVRASSGVAQIDDEMDSMGAGSLVPAALMPLVLEKTACLHDNSFQAAQLQKLFRCGAVLSRFQQHSLPPCAASLQ